MGTQGMIAINSVRVSSARSGDGAGAGRMRRLFDRVVVAGVVAGAAVATMPAQSLVPVEAIPLEPIAAIVDAFRTHDVVAVSDPHGNVQQQALLLSLVRDSRFAATRHAFPIPDLPGLLRGPACHLAQP